MAYPKKTFGQHIEDGLTFMGDGIHRAAVDARDHQLENIKLGFISDQDKLRFLKQDLYQAARARANPEHIQNLRSAIATISNQLETERNHRNSFTEQLYGILNSSILLAILAASFSFPMSWGCGLVKSQSAACETSRIIPNTAIRFFGEPK